MGDQVYPVCPPRSTLEYSAVAQVGWDIESSTLGAKRLRGQTAGPLIMLTTGLEARRTYNWWHTSQFFSGCLQKSRMGKPDSFHRSHHTLRFTGRLHQESQGKRQQTFILPFAMVGGNPRQDLDSVSHLSSKH